MSSASGCPNCATTLQGGWCHDCGQKEIHAGDLSLQHAGHHLFHETLHLDGRLWITLKLLFLQPGQLSLDFLEGRRQRHLHPVRLFLVMAALFFVLGNATVLRLEHIETRAPVVGRVVAAKAQSRGMSKSAYQAARNPVLQSTYKLAVIASVVVLGALQAMLFRRRWRQIGEHLTVASHNASAGFAFNVPAGWLMTLVPYSWAPLIASSVVMGVYDYLACRRAYGEPPAATAWKVLVMVLFTALWSAVAMGVAFRRAVAS